MDASLFSSDCDRHSSEPDEDVDQSVDLISSELQQLELECNEESSSQLLPDSEVHEDCENGDEEEEHEDDDDGDFTFMFIGDDDKPIFADGVLEDGQIRPVFPLFDQKLLLGGEYEVEEIDRLPIRPPVDNVFLESPRGFPSSAASGHEETDDSATGPYCVWSKDSGNAELSKKSNSTGFSKLWRLKEKVGRSNSDGRDAFVFLKHSDRTTTTSASKTTSSSSSSAKPLTGDRPFIKVNAAGGKARVVKPGTKGKKPTVSAHEAYLRSKGHSDEERRRSYLPYRPELMGFFTNVHYGLSKNVHPY